MTSGSLADQAEERTTLPAAEAHDHDDEHGLEWPPIEAEAEPIDNRPAGTSAVGCDRRQRRPPFRPV